MLRLLKKVLGAIAIGSTSLLIAACYGVPMDFAFCMVKVTTTDDKPIPGLRLRSLSDTSLESFSDDSGIIVVDAKDGFDLKGNYLIEDVDRESNLGEFQSKELNLSTISQSYPRYYDVVLNKVSEE